MSDGTVIAVKKLRNFHLKHAERLRRQKLIQAVVPIWAGCSHPYISPLIGKLLFNGQTATVHKWLQYGSIREYLAQCPTANRYQLSAQICDGVAYLHTNGIIHGNLKGSKILVSGDGTPQITLHGICTHMVDGVDTPWEAGTPRWMAPELLGGVVTTSFQSDVYALGMTILETITAEEPYAGMRETLVLIKTITKELPKRPMDAVPDNEAGNALWDLMCACWSYEPKERPSSADVSEIMNALGLSQPFTEAQQESESSLGFTPEIGIEEMVTFFTQHNLIDYTDELKRGDTKIKLHIPYLATAAALLYKIDLSIKGDDYQAARTEKVIVKCVVNESPYKQLKRATRELYLWSEYKHENILPLLGFAVLDGNLAMISPWIENGSVTQYVKKQQKSDYHGLCTQLSCAIAYLHEHGLIHGDIKGDNVLVSDKGIVKVADFGVSIKAHLQIEFTYTAQGRGTERWQAPEVLRRKTDSTKEGDVYAMGMTMIEIYTQERPYGNMDIGHDEKSAIIGGTLRPRRPWRIPLNSRGKTFWPLLQRCWAGNPDARPTSAEIYEQLQNM